MVARSFISSFLPNIYTEYACLLMFQEEVMDHITVSWIIWSLTEEADIQRRYVFNREMGDRMTTVSTLPDFRVK